ncbi:hypothetical protein [Streptomyces sp. NPDC047061]|uniref:hypothetical protein n=1 Tax=Streptomyces sp. NPDC047061 TaxID=3154605 RepID=UPI0033F9D2E2
MSPHIRMGVPHPAWQIKKAAVAGRGKPARAPPSSTRSLTRTTRHPFQFQEIKHT